MYGDAVARNIEMIETAAAHGMAAKSRAPAAPSSASATSRSRREEEEEEEEAARRALRVRAVGRGGAPREGGLCVAGLRVHEGTVLLRRLAASGGMVLQIDYVEGRRSVVWWVLLVAVRGLCVVVRAFSR